MRFPDRTCRGVDEVAGYFEDTFAALPDMRLEVVSIVEQGDDVFAQWRLTGTHNGPVQGIEGTGKPIELDGVDHFVLRDGRIVSNFVIFDQMQYSRQLGILPAQDSAADKAMKSVFNAGTKLVRTLKERPLGPADHVVAPDALAAVELPDEERAVEPQLSELDRGAAQHLAGAAARVVVLLADPQLEARAALVAVGVVGRRDARVGQRDRALRVEQRAPGRLVGVALGAGGPHGRDGQRAAVLEPGGRPSA